VDPPGQSPGGTVRESSDLGTFEVGAVEPAGISQQARRRPITWKFCFGAAPYTVQRHDCRGIFAGTAARVHAIGGGMMRAAVAAMITCRMLGFSCARTQTVVPRRSSAAIAIGATSIAPIARPVRVAGHCMQRGGATRRAAAAGSDMRRGRGATGHANTAHCKIK
jgi:hypothetical protein